MSCDEREARFALLDAVIRRFQKDAERPAASYSETDTFTSPHFPGLKIKGATVFKR